MGKNKQEKDLQDLILAARPVITTRTIEETVPDANAYRPLGFATIWNNKVVRDLKREEKVRTYCIASVLGDIELKGKPEYCHWHEAEIDSAFETSEMADIQLALSGTGFLLARARRVGAAFEGELYQRKENG